MRAIVITEPGGPDVLSIAEVPDAVPGSGEVVIAVAAAGVNRADLWQRQGNYPPPKGAPDWPGLEVSGRIRAVGPDVSGWVVGDEVAALLGGGGYAELVAAPAGQLMPCPAGVDLVQAAAFPEVACTVWSNLIDVAGLTSGQTLLVHGGGSGIGTFAIQLAKTMGVTVLVTCGSQEKIDACLALGADQAINYREQDFVAEVAAATNGRGADVILDVVGAKYLNRNVAALAIGGRLVIIGLQGGATGELDLRGFIGKRASIHGTTLARSLGGRESGHRGGGSRERLATVASGQIRPVIDRVVPFDQPGRAHEVVESGENFGKVLIEVGNA